MSNLVSTNWLAAQIEDVIVLDCSWHLPTANRNARLEYEKGHISGALFFDIDALSDKSTNLPHMLPSQEFFAAEVAKLGVTTNSKVICYDSLGLFSAARVWWMFKIFGHDQVFVLDGGLKKWLAEGRQIVSSVSRPVAGYFIARLRRPMVKSAGDVAKESAQIIDARSPTRFRGEEAEPRAGVRPGHIPGAKNVHYATLLNSDGTLKPKQELAQIFASAGINTENEIVTSCGSGVTAAILTLSLTELGAKQHALYDGSWAEWGASTHPVEIG